MSLTKAAAALDRLLEGQTQEASTSSLSTASSAIPPRWGIIPASTIPPSLPHTRTSLHEDTQYAEGLLPTRNTKIVIHSTPKDEYPHHVLRQLPLVDESPHPQPIRSPSTPTPSPVSRPDQAHHSIPTSPSLPHSRSIPIPSSHSIPVPNPHSRSVTSHSFPTSSFFSPSVPVNTSRSVPASSYTCPIEGNFTVDGAAAGVSESVGLRGARKSWRLLASLFNRPDPSKFKTELCRSYQVHGYCRYGVRCNYAHGLEQLRGANHHGKYKTRNCKSYHEQGCCRYGARCSFIHDPEEGVLKCSIANKEVLEALHYCPASEDSYRTAKITWRLLDSSSSPPPELHFITSNTQDAASLSLGTEMEHGLRELHNGHEVMSLSMPVGSRGSLGATRQQEGACKYQGVPISTTGLRNTNGNSAWRAMPVWPRSLRKSCNEYDRHHQKFCLQGQAAAHQARHQHSSSCYRALPSRYHRGGWYDADELMNMEVVQKILREGPHYSSTCWSTADEEIDTTPAHRNLPHKDDLLNSSFSETGNLKFELNLVSKRGSSGKREYLCDTDQDDEWGEECEPPFLCSTLRSESDSDSNMGVSEESPHPADIHVKDVPSVVHGRAFGPEEWVWRDGEGKVWASTTMPPRRYCFDLTKYKTELCRSFQYTGYCGYGDACLYAHGTLDLRSCQRHPMYRTKQCSSFHHKGYCLYGSRCQFMHDLD